LPGGAGWFGMSDETVMLSETVAPDSTAVTVPPLLWIAVVAVVGIGLMSADAVACELLVFELQPGRMLVAQISFQV
jgi:hypothetical protein